MTAALGYVIIEAEGLSPEKLLNAALAAGLKVWDVRRKTYMNITLCVSFLSYRRFIALSEEHNMTIRSERKRGLAFAFLALTKRAFLIAGAVLFIASIYAVSSFAWNVEIIGNAAILSEDIQARIAQMNIRPGLYKGNIDLEAIERALTGYEDIAWADARFNGVTLVIEVVEASRPNDDTPCDIIAARAAIIKKLLIIKGTPLVKEGDTVRAGDMLVVGSRELGSGMYALTGASAEIIGSIWVRGEASLDVNETIAKDTGREQIREYILFGSKKVLAFGEECSYEYYRTTSVTRNLVGENLFLPIRVITERYYEQSVSKKPIAADTLNRMAHNAALAVAREKVPKSARIVDEKVTLEHKDGRMNAYAVIEAEVNLGKKIPVDLNNRPVIPTPTPTE